MNIMVKDKIIGVLDSGIFTKKVKESKHLFRVLDAWGIDEQSFKKLTDETTIRICDIETGTTYEVSKREFSSNMTSRNYPPFGKQVFLPRKYWKIIESKQQKLL